MKQLSGRDRKKLDLLRETASELPSEKKESLVWALRRLEHFELRLHDWSSCQTHRLGWAAAIKQLRDYAADTLRQSVGATAAMKYTAALFAADTLEQLWEIRMKREKELPK